MGYEESIISIVANIKRGNYWYVKDQIAQLEEQCEHDPSVMAESLNGRDQVGGEAYFSFYLKIIYE